MRVGECSVFFSDVYTSANGQFPEFSKMIHFCQKGDVIVVKNLVNLAVNVHHLHRVINELYDKECHLISINNSINTMIQGQHFVYQFVNVFKDLYSQIASEQNKIRAQKNKRKRHFMSQGKISLAKEIYHLRVNQGVKTRDIIRILKVKKAQFYKLLNLAKSGEIEKEELKLKLSLSKKKNWVGRKKGLSDTGKENAKKAIYLHFEKKLKPSEILKVLHISKTSFYRYIKLKGKI